MHPALGLARSIFTLLTGERISALQRGDFARERAYFDIQQLAADIEKRLTEIAGGALPRRSEGSRPPVALIEHKNSDVVGNRASPLRHEYPAGTRLYLDWRRRGESRRRIEITVHPDGLLYEGTVYRTLKDLSGAITGETGVTKVSRWGNWTLVDGGKPTRTNGRGRGRPKAGAGGNPGGRRGRKPSRDYAPGTLLRTTFEGRVYEIEALGNSNYQYAGERFSSLYQVAKHITGRPKSKLGALAAWRAQSADLPAAGGRRGRPRKA